MGDRWYVSCARAGLPALALLIFTACSNANLGWNSFSAGDSFRLGPGTPPLRVSGPNFVSAAASCAGPFSVSFSDDSGNSILAPGDVPVQLSGTGAPFFYSDSSCAHAVVSIQIAKGSSGQDFYLTNPKVGSQQLTAMNPALPSVARSYQVDPSAITALTITGPTSFAAGACVPYDVTFQDSVGNTAAYDQTQTLLVSITGGAQFYSDPTCQSSLSASTSFPLSPGMSDQLFYVSNTSVSTAMVLDSSAPFATSRSLQTTATSAVATSIALVNLSSPAQVNLCSEITVYPTDASGNAVALGTITVNFLANHPTAQFFTDPNCSSSGSSINVPAGGKNNIFVLDTAHETTAIVASSVSPVLSGSLSVVFQNLAVQVAAGDSHTCALMNDQSVSCWGSNSNGQLGPAAAPGALAVPASAAAAVPLSAGPATLVSAGMNHSCAIIDNGLSIHQVWCWGANDHGQLGFIGADSATPLLAMDSLVPLIALASGDAFNCVLDNTGTVYCWGDNTFGQVGDNATIGGNQPTPTQLGLVLGTTQWLSAAGSTVCSMDVPGNYFCWGSNAYGQLTLPPPTTDSVNPWSVSGIAHAGGIGRNQACQIDQITFNLSCWGRNLFGELGVLLDFGTSTGDPNPQSLGIQRATPYGPAISGGDGFTCVVQSAGGVLCFGRNDQGQLGNGSTISSYEPTLVPIQVASGSQPGFAAGKAHACAAAVDGRVGCWGLNDHAQIGPAPAGKPYSTSIVWTVF